MGQGWALWFLLICRVGVGQQAALIPKAPVTVSQFGGSAAVPAAAAVVLKELAARAGVIFAGHVIDVWRHDGEGYVDVVFAVDQAVRGCGSSGRYVLREWAGLWTEEPRRYEQGQRLLMVLAGRGPSGMSAPVGGMAGRIPLIGMRQPPVATAAGAPADTGDRLEEAVDLRWVEAVEARPMAVGENARAEAAKVPGWGGPVGPIRTKPISEVGLSAVLAVLGAQ